MPEEARGIARALLEKTNLTAYPDTPWRTPKPVTASAGDEVAEGAGREGRPRGDAERFREAVGHGDLGRRRGGEVERDRAVVGGMGDEDAAAAREADGAPAPRSRYIAWAVASVAWPQRFVSTSGVNQRSAQSASPPSLSGWANAVSERCNSAATCCIHASSGHASASSSRQTVAGLPPNGRSVNASMMRIRMGQL